MDGVNDNSLLRYIPIPPGLVLKVEKSAPIAPKAPAIASERAVPPKVSCEYLKASTLYWAHIKVLTNIAPETIQIFFIKNTIKC